MTVNSSLPLMDVDCDRQFRSVLMTHFLKLSQVPGDLVLNALYECSYLKSECTACDHYGIEQWWQSVSQLSRYVSLKRQMSCRWCLVVVLSKCPHSSTFNPRNCGADVILAWSDLYDLNSDLAIAECLYCCIACCCMCWTEISRWWLFDLCVKVV